MPAIGTLTSCPIEVSHPIEAGMKTYPGLERSASEVVLDHLAHLSAVVVDAVAGPGRAIGPAAFQGLNHEHPFLTGEACDDLLDAGVRFVGVDAVPTAGGYLHAVPIAWKGGASFPVRAYVMM